jgi:predicted SAM-dependent methyltransferase
MHVNNHILDLPKSDGGIPNYSIYSLTFEPTLKAMLSFELRSLLGRWFLKRSVPRLSGNTQLLHLGCGKNKLAGFVNADFFPALRSLIGGGKPDWMLDLRYPLACQDNYWDGIVSEHVLEHLAPYFGLRLLKECRRVLKSNCWIRISVPDLRKYIEYYSGAVPCSPDFKIWNTGAEAIRTLTQNWTHRAVWDAVLLTRVLQEAGFTNIRERKFAEGTDHRLIVDLEHRRWESLYMEAQKPSNVP